MQNDIALKAQALNGEFADRLDQPHAVIRNECPCDVPGGVGRDMTVAQGQTFHLDSISNRVATTPSNCIDDASLKAGQKVAMSIERRQYGPGFFVQDFTGKPTIASAHRLVSLLAQLSADPSTIFDIHPTTEQPSCKSNP
tara:strand:+ start:511 stop:930 length:420 start_codon:yes stop_codon:yes gene_type:complete